MPARVIPAHLGGAEPLAAAGRFHEELLSGVEEALAAGESVVVSFDFAEDKPHRWRREVIAALARKHAPLRVNAVAPAGAEPDEARIRAVIDFLIRNGGVTGQLLIAG